MPRALSISGIVVAILLILVFGLDAGARLPGWRGKDVRGHRLLSGRRDAGLSELVGRCASCRRPFLPNRRQT